MDEQLSLERSSRKRKFKQRYDEVEIGNIDERIAEDENPRKVCRLCKKEFDSGKALGGHMRVHAQELSSQRSISGDGYICSFVAGEDTGKKNCPNYELHSSDTPFCNLCGRAFHSWKSLYGHMRCHPGRPWKGIPAQSDDSARNRSRRGVDLLSHIAGWPITGKRGRGSSLRAPEMDIMEAAQNLLWLSTGTGDEYFYEDKKISECTAGEGGFCYEEIGVRIESESCFILLDDSNSEQKKMGQPGICSLMPKKVVAGEGNTVEKKKRGRKKKVQVDPIVQVTRPIYPAAGGEFQCVTCSKKFSTYQALGGHRSKHYREGNGVESCFFHPGSGPGPDPQNGSNGVQCLAGEVWGLWEATKLVVDVNQPAKCI